MNRYFVTWVIDIDADSPEDAAREALRIQRDRESTATFFLVQPSSAVSDAAFRAVSEGAREIQVTL